MNSGPNGIKWRGKNIMTEVLLLNQLIDNKFTKGVQGTLNTGSTFVISGDPTDNSNILTIKKLTDTIKISRE